MTARDERLEAAAKAYFEADLGEPWETADANQRSQALRWAVGVTASYDAVRAFDEQRKEVMPHSPELRTHNATAPAASPVGADPPWLDALISQCFSRASGKLTFEEAQQIARAVLRFAADPPWLDEAAEIARTAYHWRKDTTPQLGASAVVLADWRNVARAVLAFAATQPPSAEEIEAVDAGIEAASEAVSALPDGQKGWDRKEYMIAETAARAALLAAARVRAGG